MLRALLDTSVYVSALRRGNNAILELRNLTIAPLWLSSVVLEELYAGCGPREQRVVERLEHDFDRAKRIVVPNLKDWAQTGLILSKLSRKYGHEQIGRARLTNDALIATSAGRCGIHVMTANERAYRRLAELCPFFWQTV